MIGATGRLNSIRKEINSVIDEINVTDSIVREMQKTSSIHSADDSSNSNRITVNNRD